jgi:ABC-type dipeptide/oligopeptide/nickel transport system permease subunit
MRAWRRFTRHRGAAAALVALGLLGLYCALWPVVSPYDPNEVDFARKLQLPGLHHPFGTDLFGRDLLTRMALGGRISVGVALGAALVVAVVGLAYGGIAGYAGGRVDEAMMRVLDALFAIPRLPFYIVFLVVMAGRDTGVWTLIVALSAVSWLATARLVRMQVVSLRSSDYVRAARSLGARAPHVFLRHLAPNTFAILLVGVLLELPALLLGEALVSVLGLGPNPPTATWGNIAQEGIVHHRIWAVLLPSIAITGFAVCASFVADGVQEALDPRRDWGQRPPSGRLRRLLGVRPVPLDDSREVEAGGKRAVGDA